ncbi:multicopper oxidase [Actinoplanes capillaceus]|uniref:Multicopper oxidase n=1 Tax=Actinoplanes campanulatus TaxID=113559 RepID=A0ABQ3W9L6_9ACTN|nr:multicopper oxidase domain-containing protein [Actinoplanes capillaceus]GID43737.1 multicopper oxidase [Actinoplanes capillaceus]
MKRRSLLSLAVLGPLLSGCSGADEQPLTFANRLHIPPLAPSEIDPDGFRSFALDLQPGKNGTWGINGDHLGPTVRAKRGERVRMAVTNRLPEATTLHWHGMRLPARMDGGPHQSIEPGATWTPRWTVDQPAATTWFHPHPHGKTAMHVYRGLAGLFLIDEPGGPALPSDYGADDIPLIVQDKILDDGRLVTGPVGNGTFGLLGDTIMINGTIDPYVEVTTTQVRFRLLNASNTRVYRIGFADNRTFNVVGGDAGLLREPVPADRVKISPGERIEIVAAFSPGETVVLDSIGENRKDANDPEEDDFELLKVVAAASLKPSRPLPQALGGPAPVIPPPGARVRRFALSGSEINGRDMDMNRIDEVIPAGAVEIWEIDNTTYAHNFHIHEVAFTILDINGEPPPAYLAGPKDTVFLKKHADVRLAVRFGRHTDPVTPYMYHCHLLRHEDKGMMGQFVIVDPGTEHLVPRFIPTGHHHHG